MQFYEASDKQILKELGSRVKSLRLRKNITQEKLAESSLLSPNTIKSLEKGKAKLSTLVNVLRELNHLEHLDHFIPPIEISPLELAKRKNKTRKRAYRKRTKNE